MNFEARLIHPNASVEDTIALMKRVAKEQANSKAVNDVLRNFPFKATVGWFTNVFWHLDTLITYQLDAEGREQIKTPDRTIRDQKGDCDDFSTFWAAILERVGIGYYIKIVKYRKNGSWAHVYITVPTKEGQHLVLDNVYGKETRQFGTEVKHVDSNIY